MAAGAGQRADDAPLEEYGLPLDGVAEQSVLLRRLAGPPREAPHQLLLGVGVRRQAEDEPLEEIQLARVELALAAEQAREGDIEVRQRTLAPPVVGEDALQADERLGDHGSLLVPR